MTKTGSINFFSHTILENVDATNNHVLAVINIPKKDLAFSLYMKQFVFRKKLMQEHFNENYVESDKFPKATFSGSFSENVPLDKEGTYPVKVRGKLSIHGVTKPIEIPATLTVKSGTMTGTSTFKLNPKDFDISIPFIVRDKIEKENTVTVNVEWTRNN
jgi:polyisoprenoid-binding protein YceI